MSTALYRRYRPDTFTEVIGQEHVTEPLMQALRSDKVTHAYLFSGPRGCGKTTSARILARCLNCATGPTATPCGECDSCRELGRGGPGSLDVVEIDAASHNGVDDARDLRERAAFAPARDRFKIFILDEAHMVTPQGFNALLKIVEEPPPHVKFIFATTEPDKVIGTIRSRTHHYPFRLVAPDTLQPYLDQLCVAEGVTVGAGVLPLVVRAGGGSVRDSLSVLDQLVAGATAGGIDYERAVALLGYTHAALLDDAVDAIAARDGASAFRVVDRVVSSGHEPRRFVEDLLERLRDLIVIAASGDAAQAVLRDLPADQLDRMRAQASTLGASELSRSADLVNAALSEMTGATSPRLHLELLVARLLLPAADDGMRGVAARLDRVERELGAGRAASGIAPVAAEPVAVVPSAAAVATPAPVAPAPAAPTPAAAAPAAPTPAAPTPAAAAPAAPPVESAPGAPAVPVVPAAVPAAPRGPAEQPAARPSVAAIEAELVRRRWPEVLDTLKGLRRATWVLVDQNATVHAVGPESLTLAFGTPQLATTFRTGTHADNVRRALHESLGIDVRVETVLSDAAPDAGSAPAAASGSTGTRGGGTAAAPGSAAPGRISAQQAEASWSVPGDAAPSSASQGRGSSAAVTSPPPAGARTGSGTPTAGGAPGASPTSGASGARAGDRQHAGGPAGDAAHRAQPTPFEGAAEHLPSSVPPWDDIPDGPEPDTDAPPEHAGRSSSPGLDAARAARITGGVRPGPQVRPAAGSVEESADASPDDPDLSTSGLVGAPLIAQMLGGTVIDEIPDPPV